MPAGAGVADGLLPDVCDVSLSAIGQTALAQALERITSQGAGCNFNSFNSSI